MFESVLRKVFRVICFTHHTQKQNKKTLQHTTKYKIKWRNKIINGCPGSVCLCSALSLSGFIFQTMNDSTWCKICRGPDWRLHSLSGEERWINSCFPFLKRILCHPVEMISGLSRHICTSLSRSPSFVSLSLFSQMVLSSSWAHIYSLFPNLWLIKYDSERKKCNSVVFDASFLVGVSKYGTFEAKY